MSMVAAAGDEEEEDEEGAALKIVAKISRQSI